MGKPVIMKKQKKQLQEAKKKKGYDSAFLIAFKNGEKISVEDAIKN